MHVHDCDKSAFGAQPRSDTRHLEHVALATKEKRLEASTVGSRTPTEIEAEVREKEEGGDKQSKEKDTKGGGVQWYSN